MKRNGFLLIMLLCLFLTGFYGCRTKQVVVEKVISKTDSAALLKLRSEVREKAAENESLKREISSVKSENVRLREEQTIHTINYDTGGMINPETGKYPIANETMTSSKSSHDKQIKEIEDILYELSKRNDRLTTKNRNLELAVEAEMSERRELQDTIIKIRGKRWSAIVWSLLSGLAAGLILSRRIEKLFNWGFLRKILKR